MADMTQTPVVEPLSATPPAAPEVEPQAPEQEAPAEEAASQLPPELLKIPAIQAVLVGTPPAVSMSIKGSENRDEVKLVSDNKDSLLSAGMGFYRSLSGDRGVMFNGLRIHPDDLKAADKAGQLLQIAPDFDLLNQEVAKGGKGSLLLQATAPSGAAPAARSSMIAPQAQSGSLPLVPPAPAAVAKKLATQRMLNLQPGPPTSGAAPGAGRILNQIMRPAV